MATEPPARSLRVGHSERDAVAEILQKAAAEGRLTMAELDERLDAALRAKTYGDLEPLTADLTGGGSVAPAAQPSGVQLAGSGVQGPPPPGYSPEDPLRLDGGMSSEKRTGVWTVPPFIRISQGVGAVKLNCLQAIPAAPLIEIEMIAGAGSALLILPDGWGVDDDRLDKSWGTKSVKVSREPAPGMPLLVVRGSVGMGSFKARPGSQRERRRIDGV